VVNSLEFERIYGIIDFAGENGRITPIDRLFVRNLVLEDTLLSHSGDSSAVSMLSLID